MIIQTAVVVEPPPTTPPVPPAVEVHPMSVRWTSWDGRYWDLSDWANSPLFLSSWLEGLGPTDAEHWYQPSPSIDGPGQWTGLHVPGGQVVLEMLSYSDGPSSEFLTQHRQFMRSLNPREVGVLRVTRPDGTWLEKTCRYESGANMPHAIDPVFSRNVRYIITWASDPHWSGEPVEWEVEYSAATGDFYPGPPWTLLPSQLLGGDSATVDNPGDVPAFPLWRIDGPFAGFTVGVGDTLVTSTLTKPFGGWVEIDMRPNNLTVTDETGADHWATLTDAHFSSIPPGVSSVVTTSNGAGPGSKVSLSFRPLYEGAL